MHTPSDRVQNSSKIPLHLIIGEAQDAIPLVSEPLRSSFIALPLSRIVVIRAVDLDHELQPV